MEKGYVNRPLTYSDEKYIVKSVERNTRVFLFVL